MTETTSGKEQARSQVADVASQAQEKVQETARQATSQAQSRAREQLDTRSTQAGEQVRTVAQAIRKSSEELRTQQQEGPATVVERAADQAERLGGYLEQANADEILRDVEDFGRRRPWLIAASGFALGLVGSRFLKASSQRRYQGNGASAGRHWESGTRVSMRPESTAGRDWESGTRVSMPPESTIGPGV